MRSQLRLGFVVAVGVLLLAALNCSKPPQRVATAPVNVASEAPPTREPRRNVLLITLDTTRADHLGAFGYAKADTPALDALAAQGTVFEQAYTVSPMTLPSHTTLLTGLQPPEHGLHVNGKSRLGTNVQTLATILGEHGYQTGAFVSAFVLNRKFGLDRGFQVYDDDLTNALPQEVSEQLSVHRSGGEATDAALAWLSKASPAPQPSANTQPFFCWVHLYDPHYPYGVHPELSGTRYEGQASYDAEIAFMDLQVARLMRFLDERGLRQNTLVVAVADHGEGLEDHGEAEHGYLLNEEVLHVPLIVSLPEVVSAGQRVGAMVSSVDVMPTILDVLGVSAERGSGRSLKPALLGETIESLPAYSETDLPYDLYGWNPLRSLTTPEWKYVRSTRAELYDRARDRGELYNLSSARPEEVQMQEAQLSAFESRMSAPAAPQQVALSENEKERMRALGYTTDTQHAAPPVLGAKIAGLKDIKDMLPVKHLDTALMRGTTMGTLSNDQRVKMARTLVERSPETAAFQNRLGAALLDSGKFADAEQPLTEAIRLQPDLPEAHSNLGAALAHERKIDDALREFRESLRLQPDNSQAHFGMANALEERGELDTALGHYAEAVRYRPNFAEAYYNMGNVLVRENKAVPAIQRYREAIAIDSGFAAAHFNLANQLRQEGETDDAIGEYREALRLQPNAVDVHNNLGLTLAESGQLASAKQEYVAALKIQPSFARAHHNLGNLLAQTGNCTEAYSHYGEAVRLHPEDVDFVSGYAMALATCPERKQRDAKRAVAMAEKAASTSPANPRVLRVLATAYAEDGQLREATRTANAALNAARAEGEPSLVKQIQQQLAGYSTVQAKSS